MNVSRLAWRKSSRSGPNCDNCVEVAIAESAIAVRDSKNPTGPALTFTRDEWSTFVGGTRGGGFAPA
nr:DUF397 domain-containing protein [Micromonospora sp. DSM 115978]